MGEKGGSKGVGLCYCSTAVAAAAAARSAPLFTLE